MAQRDELHEYLLGKAKRLEDGRLIALVKQGELRDWLGVGHGHFGVLINQLTISGKVKAGYYAYELIED